MKIPFKFLDPYKKADIGFYFGREDDTLAIYEMVKKNRIVLVYGPSGTGKTSLIQCGLANKFDQTDWLPFFIRRKENINNSLVDCLKAFFIRDKKYSLPNEKDIEYNKKYVTERPGSADLSQSFFNEIGISFTDEEIKSAKKPGAIKTDADSKYRSNHSARLITYLLKISELTLRPVYLVFDQLEELLIYGTESEKNTFLDSLKIITTSNSLVSCHVIILMREEFFAMFDKFEKVIPGISDRRLRVEPLMKEDITRVIRKTLEYKPFNIELEDTDVNVEQIYNVLADKKGEVSMPYLQVYFDQLWREDFARTYPTGFSDDTSFAPVKFTSQEITDFGEIGDVLQKFLTERKIRIAEKLKEKGFQNIGDDFINKVLNEFVSDYGTKLPIIFEYVDGQYHFPTITKKIFDGFPADALQFTLKKLEKYKLIRKEPTTLELAHDILAKLIDEQRDYAERRRIRIRVNIKDYLKTKDASLSINEVNEWDNEIEKCNLNQAELDFFYKWREIRKKEETLKQVALKEEQAAKDLAQLREQAAARMALKDEEHKRKEEEHKRKEVESELRYREGLKKKRNNILKIAGVLSIPIIALLIWNYVNIKRYAYKYYAFNFFAGKADTIPNKKDALKLAYYIYRKTKNYDDVTTSEIQSSIIRLASDTSLQNIRSRQSISLFSSKQFKLKENVDISADGRFICVEYDSVFLNSPRRKFALFEVGNNEPVDTFSRVYYSYFLKGTNKLLLATSNTDGINYPNEIILYNCETKHSQSTISLNKINPYYFLQTADFLRRTRYSEFDSYDIRKTASGNLLVPVTDLASFAGQSKILLLDPNFQPINKPIATNYSVSNSRDNRFFAIATTKNFDYLKIIDEFGRAVTREIPDILWADITPGNALIFRTGDKLYKTTKFTESGEVKVIDSLPSDLGSGFNYAYLVNDESTAVISLSDRSIQLSSLSRSAQRINKTYNEDLIGINYKENAMISIPRLKTAAEGQLYDSVILKRNLTDLNLKADTISFSTSIISFQFNPKTGRTIVETARESKSGKSFIYVIDSDLKKMGAFVLTPNDSYAFSEDGNTLFVINDHQLNVFRIKGGLYDFSNFQQILNWMKENTNDSIIDGLKEKYQVRFPKVFF